MYTAIKIIVTFGCIGCSSALLTNPVTTRIKTINPLGYVRASCYTNKAFSERS